MNTSPYEINNFFGRHGKLPRNTIINTSGSNTRPSLFASQIPHQYKQYVPLMTSKKSNLMPKMLNLINLLTYIGRLILYFFICLNQNLNWVCERPFFAYQSFSFNLFLYFYMSLSHLKCNVRFYYTLNIISCHSIFNAALLVRSYSYSFNLFLNFDKFINGS